MKKLFLTTVVGLLVLPITVLAAERLTFIEQIPFLNGPATTTEDFVSALYYISISIASILVVLRIIYAGSKLMLSESVSARDSAKREITGSLLGLLVILGAVTILNTINPQITRTDVFRNADPASTSGSGGGPGSPVNESARCPKGQVWMECTGGSGGDGAKCSVPQDQSWCDGQLENFGN